MANPRDAKPELSATEGHRHRCREGHSWEHRGVPAADCRIPEYASDLWGRYVSVEHCPVCTGREDFLAPGPHTHRCPTCRGEWTHDGRCAEPAEARCPRCAEGAKESWSGGYRSGAHIHACPRCVQTWEHAEPCQAPHRAVLPDCPGCAAKTWPERVAAAPGDSFDEKPRRRGRALTRWVGVACLALAGAVGLAVLWTRPPPSPPGAPTRVAGVEPPPSPAPPAAPATPDVSVPMGAERPLPEPAAPSSEAPPAASGVAEGPAPEAVTTEAPAPSSPEPPGPVPGPLRPADDARTAAPQPAAPPALAPPRPAETPPAARPSRRERSEGGRVTGPSARADAPRQPTVAAGPVAEAPPRLGSRRAAGCFRPSAPAVVVSQESGRQLGLWVGVEVDPTSPGGRCLYVVRRADGTLWVMDAARVRLQ
jgi:hypothetical protein